MHLISTCINKTVEQFMVKWLVCPGTIIIECLARKYLTMQGLSKVENYANGCRMKNLVQGLEQVLDTYPVDGQNGCIVQFL